MTCFAQGTATPANSESGEGRDDLVAEGGVVAIETPRAPTRLPASANGDGEVEESLLQSSQRPIVRLLIVEDDEEDFDLVEALLSRAPETRFDVVWRPASRPA